MCERRKSLRLKRLISQEENCTWENDTETSWCIRSRTYHRSRVTGENDRAPILTLVRFIFCFIHSTKLLPVVSMRKQSTREWWSVEKCDYFYLKDREENYIFFLIFTCKAQCHDTRVLLGHCYMVTRILRVFFLQFCRWLLTGQVCDFLVSRYGS